MVDEVIKIINRELQNVFGKYPGVKVFGMTQQLIRQVGTEVEIIPAVVNMEGEGKWAGVDDTAPLIMYHKTLSPMIVGVARSGYGDAEDVMNRYSHALIVYFDRSRIGLSADEVQRFVQVNMPVLMRAEKLNFKSIRINVLSVSIDGQQIYQAEYKNEKNLDPGKSMVQINYQIESRFSKACFATCP